MVTFHYRLNGGLEQFVSIHSGLYKEGARAAIDRVVLEELRKGVVEVEIWSPTLVSEYGPYFYHARVVKEDIVSIESVFIV